MVAVVLALLMFAVSAALVLLFHFSDPFDSGFSTANKVALSISAISAMTFISVGFLLYRGRVGVVAIRVAEVIFWIDLVAIFVSTIGLLAVGSISIIVWMVAIGVGFDLARELRYYWPLRG
ncbi:hypothetical protein [Nocardia sp. NPDC058497]|uniref:hypothetical protein n=1 Tax=Nocardia sp. NPDC058497 TaxID=3346529 RepID=UPI00365B9ABD